MSILLVALGGATGSVLRFLLGTAVQRAGSTAFPIGTLAVNLIGCFAIGVLLRLTERHDAGGAIRSLLVVGFCGGFTTFSAFSAETLALLSAGDVGKGVAYILASVVGCLLATVAGWQLGG
jgi:CrcB protein